VRDSGPRALEALRRISKGENPLLFDLPSRDQKTVYRETRPEDKDEAAKRAKKLSDEEERIIGDLW